ncbi:hypothetical protein ACHAXT_003325 [Thalassiosira profunda]
MLALQDAAAELRRIAFDPSATLLDLLRIVFAFSALWLFVFTIAAWILRRITRDAPWLRAAIERDYERSTKEMYEQMGIKTTKEEAMVMLMNDWAPMQVIAIQHLAGSLLCVPSILGIGDPSWASSLAVLGVLSEMGWEIEHACEMVYTRLFTPGGEKKVPNGLVVIIIFHHSLTCILGLPMVLHYRELKALHWLCFNLQLGGAIIVVIEYSKFLDVSRPRDLAQFKALNLLLVLFSFWTRGLHWFYLCGEVILTWYQDKNWTFMAVGSPPILLFTLFNVLCNVIPMFKRWRKFRHVVAEYEAVPSDAPMKMRRQSTMNLEAAVAELLAEEEKDPFDRVQDFLESLERPDRKIERRATMPPKRGRRGSVNQMMKMQSVPAHKWMKED